MNEENVSHSLWLTAGLSLKVHYAKLLMVDWSEDHLPEKYQWVSATVRIIWTHPLEYLFHIFGQLCLRGSSPSSTLHSVPLIFHCRRGSSKRAQHQLCVQSEMRLFIPFILQQCWAKHRFLPSHVDFYLILFCFFLSPHCSIPSNALTDSKNQKEIFTRCVFDGYFIFSMM